MGEISHLTGKSILGGRYNFTMIQSSENSQNLPIEPVFQSFYDNERRDRTDIAIFDGKHISHGPIAVLHLKHYIVYGLQGCFAPIVG